MFKEYDIIVVGAGHAGCEAAAAAANLGSSVLMVTMNMSNMAQMSCNPAMGGIAKGQIVREIDALGGYSGIVTDHSMIQFRMLNKSKGPAMWSPRAQCDRMMFSETWRMMLENTENLDFWQDVVTSVIIRYGVVYGVNTALGISFKSKAVILNNGTFLNGVIHIGEKKLTGGRIGERPSKGITEALGKIGFKYNRMKTGTPVRVDGRTIDFSKLEEQSGDEKAGKFSYLKTERLTKQRSCFLAYTSQEVHNILKTGFEQSPMYTGRIKGIGPRYCPSIEDKIDRFSDKDKHQLFVEPEGWNTIEYYINGFSSSLPLEVQLKALRSVVGFENAQIFRPGYAIEYDFFPPEQLKSTLETKLIKNLYFAGQINGTTGYEEAAAQGLMAGINAHRKLVNKDEFVLRRSDAYIGVLIDDLITKGVDEPYRMFTSRAEYRILLRQDNADMRLTKMSHDIGLASVERIKLGKEKENATEKIIKYTKRNSVAPGVINELLKRSNTPEIKQKVKISNLILRPQIRLSELIENVNVLKDFIGDIKKEITIDINEIIEESEILIKYDGYISKEKEIADKIAKLEDIPLKEDIDYQKLKSLSFEAREKLSKIKPGTIAQAARISGVSPADISVLIVYLGR